MLAKISRYKISSFVIVGFMFVLMGCPALPPYIGWTYGGDGWDLAYAIHTTSDGGYILAGETTSLTKTDYDRDIYLVKIDSVGNLLWEKAFGGSGEDEGCAVEETSDGGYVFAGTIYINEENKYSNDYDMYLAKTDAGGNLLWEKTFGGSKCDRACAMDKTNDDGYILVGESNSFNEVDTYEAYMVKTDADGNLLWESHFGTHEWEEGCDVQQTSDGGYILAISALDIQGENVLLPKACIAKTDGNGNLIWSSNTFSGTGFAYAGAIQQTNDGEYILAGTTGKILGNRYTLLNMYLVKIDENGYLLWEKTLTGPLFYEDQACAIQEVADGGFMIAGSKTGYNQWNPSGMCLTCVDPDGNILWENIYGGSNAHAMTKTSDGFYILAGGTDLDEGEDFVQEDKDMYVVKTSIR